MRRSCSTLLVIALLFALGLFAQEQPPSDKPQENPPQDQNANKKEKKKKDKKDKKDNKSQDVFYSTVFTDAVANSVLSDLRDGLEGHSSRLMLSAFDSEKMDGYLSFEDQIESFFQRYEAFRVHYRISQSTVEGPKGVVLVDWEMEEIPSGGNAPPQRRNGQIRFVLERGKKGWKIVDFNPRGIFS